MASIYLAVSVETKEYHKNRTSTVKNIEDMQCNFDQKTVEFRENGRTEKGQTNMRENAQTKMDTVYPGRYVNGWTYLREDN